MTYLLHLYFAAVQIAAMLAVARILWSGRTARAGWIFWPVAILLTVLAPFTVALLAGQAAAPRIPSADRRGR